MIMSNLIEWELSWEQDTLYLKGHSEHTYVLSLHVNLAK